MKKLAERFHLPLDAKLLLFVSPTEEKCVPAEEIFWISDLQAPQAPWDSKKWPYQGDLTGRPYQSTLPILQRMALLLLITRALAY